MSTSFPFQASKSDDLFLKKLSSRAKRGDLIRKEKKFIFMGLLLCYTHCNDNFIT
jgi:hypothetical protein